MGMTGILPITRLMLVIIITLDKVVSIAWSTNHGSLHQGGGKQYLERRHESAKLMTFFCDFYCSSLHIGNTSQSMRRSAPLLC